MRTEIRSLHLCLVRRQGKCGGSKAKAENGEAREMHVDTSDIKGQVSEVGCEEMKLEVLWIELIA